MRHHLGDFGRSREVHAWQGQKVERQQNFPAHQTRPIHDGLPNDEYQQMQIETMAVMNKITSTKAAAKRIYRLTDDQSDEDQKQMAEEAKVNGGGLF